MLLTTHPLLLPRSWRSGAILLSTLWTKTGPVTGTLHSTLYTSPCTCRVVKAGFAMGRTCSWVNSFRIFCGNLSVKLLFTVVKLVPLRLCENRVLRRIFGPKRDEVTGEWRKLHNENCLGD